MKNVVISLSSLFSISSYAKSINHTDCRVGNVIDENRVLDKAFITKTLTQKGYIIDEQSLFNAKKYSNKGIEINVRVHSDDFMPIISGQAPQYDPENDIGRVANDTVEFLFHSGHHKYTCVTTNDGNDTYNHDNRHGAFCNEQTSYYSRSRSLTKITN